MPPIMGAAAFLMSEFIEVPYSTIIISAALPALLYLPEYSPGCISKVRNRALKGCLLKIFPSWESAKRKRIPYPSNFAIVYFLVRGMTRLKRGRRDSDGYCCFVD